MKKRVLLCLDVESDDPYLMDDGFIKGDLMQEITCCSNFYELNTFCTLDMDKVNEILGEDK